MYAAACQGLMQSLLYVMPAMFTLCQTMFHSVKEQPFMYLTTQPTEHYSKGVVHSTYSTGSSAAAVYCFLFTVSVTYTFILKKAKQSNT